MNRLYILLTCTLFLGLGSMAQAQGIRYDHLLMETSDLARALRYQILNDETTGAELLSIQPERLNSLCSLYSDHALVGGDFSFLTDLRDEAARSVAEECIRRISKNEPNAPKPETPTGTLVKVERCENFWCATYLVESKFLSTRKTRMPDSIQAANELKPVYLAAAILPKAEAKIEYVNKRSDHYFGYPVDGGDYLEEHVWLCEIKSRKAITWKVFGIVHTIEDRFEVWRRPVTGWDPYKKFGTHKVKYDKVDQTWADDFRP